MSAPAEIPVTRSTRYDPPSVIAAQEKQSQRFLLLVVRLVFIVMLATVTILTVYSTQGDSLEDFDLTTVAGLFLASVAIGVVVLLVDSMTPNKRLATMTGVYMGVCAGLLGALAIGALLDVVAQAWEINEGITGQYLGLGKVIIGIILCYLAVSVVLTTKDDFRLVIPYVEFSRQVRGVRPMLVDTSALIDGRIDRLGQTGFIDAPLIVPQFVIEELQRLGDSSDKLKRARGRRGLSLVADLQTNPYIDVSIDPVEVTGHSVDHMLLQMARDQSLRIVTTDYNLNKVAQIHGVEVLNVNDLANTMKSQAIPGDVLTIEIVKPGEGEGQGVGYMPDGTMVVVEEAAGSVGESISLMVTNSLQTSAGRMIFGKLVDADQLPDDPEPATPEPPHRDPESLAQAATAQPRSTEPPGRRPVARSRRNPRR